MRVWEWDSAHAGRAMCGIVAHPDRAVARHLIERRMREAGALSALAVEVERDDDGWGTRSPTGRAMIARAQDYRLRVIGWRDVQEPARR